MIPNLGTLGTIGQDLGESQLASGLICLPGADRLSLVDFRVGIGHKKFKVILAADERQALRPLIATSKAAASKLSHARRSIPLLFVLVTSAWATRAMPQDASPGDNRNLATARDLLHQAARALDEQYRKDPGSGPRYATDLAADLAEVGDHDAAEATIHHLRFSDAIDATALRSVATGYARAGDISRVRQTIARIQDAGLKEYNPRAWAWFDSGRALAKSGHKEWAAEAFAEAARGLTEAWPLQSELLTAIAEGQHEIGRDDASAATLDRTASRVLADRKRGEVLIGGVVAAQARLGFLPQAMAVVERSTDPERRSYLYCDIVEALSAVGRLDEAYRVAARVEGSAITRTWVAIAAAEARTGHPAEAGRALARAEVGAGKAVGAQAHILMLITMSEAHATIGDRDGAVDRLVKATAIAKRSVGAGMRSPAFVDQREQVPGAVDRRVNFLWIAAAQAKLGLTDVARDSFEEAKVAVRGEPTGMWRIAAVTSIASSHSQAR